MRAKVSLSTKRLVVIHVPPVDPSVLQPWLQSLQKVRGGARDLRAIRALQEAVEDLRRVPIAIVNVRGEPVGPRACQLHSEVRIESLSEE